MSEMAPKSDRKARAITAGLSAVGATAGLAGLAYGAHDMRAAVKLGTKIPLRAKALVPLEVAGLGGEASATTILGGDAKKQKKGQAMTSTGGTRQSGQANAVGKRMTTGLPAEEIAKGAVSTRAGRAVVQALGTPKHPTRLGAVNPVHAGAGAAAGAGVVGGGVLVARKKKVSKSKADVKETAASLGVAGGAGLGAGGGARYAILRGAASSEHQMADRSYIDSVVSAGDGHRLNASIHNMNAVTHSANELGLRRSARRSGKLGLAGAGVMGASGLALHQMHKPAKVKKAGPPSDNFKALVYNRDVVGNSPEAAGNRKIMRRSRLKGQGVGWSAGLAGGAAAGAAVGKIPKVGRALKPLTESGKQLAKQPGGMAHAMGALTSGPSRFGAYTGGVGGALIGQSTGDYVGARRGMRKPGYVAKARRADPEMDRQRRIGAAAGLAGGGAIVAGNEARHHLDVHRKPGSGDIGVLVKTPPGVKGARNPLARVRGGKAGAAIGATAALAGLSGAAVAHGVSERNKSWN